MNLGDGVQQAFSCALLFYCRKDIGGIMETVDNVYNRREVCAKGSTGKRKK